MKKVNEMSCFDHTALSLSLDNALKTALQKHGPDIVTEEVQSKMRDALERAMHEQLQDLKPHQTCRILSPPDPTGQYPIYRVMDGDMTLILKDVRIDCQRENGYGEESFVADYMRIETRVGEGHERTALHRKKRGR